jgi:hypothetical protein
MLTSQQKNIVEQYKSLKEQFEMIEKQSKYFLWGYFGALAEDALVSEFGIKKEFAEVIIEKAFRKMVDEQPL